MSGFSNPILAAGGALAYPSIHSPNFNVANPAGSPVPSWGILKSGLAYFFGLALSGGTITGPDYVLDPTGFYFYTGTPALGNPPVAWISQATADPFGNALPAKGIATFNAASDIISQLTLGQLRLGVGSDFSVGIMSSLSGHWALASPQVISTDTAAAFELNSLSSPSNASGFPELKLDNGTVLYVHGGQVLIASGADIFGGATNVTSLIDSGNAVISGTTTAHNALTITAGGLAVTGGTTTDTLAVTSTSTLGAKETITAGGLAVTGGTTTDTLTVAGETTLTPQVISGHPVIKQTDQSVITVTAIANAAITNAWPINGGDAQNGTVYELEAGGYGAQGSTQETLRMQLSFMGVNIGSDVLPAATIPVSAQFEWTFKGVVSVVSNGAAGKARAQGEFKIWEVNGPASDTMIIGQHAAVPPAADSTVNTTVNQTVSLGASWGSATGAPTITGGWSTLARSGP